MRFLAFVLGVVMPIELATAQDLADLHAELLAQLSASQQAASTMEVDGKTVHVVSAVLRYYTAEGGWRALEHVGENHPTINVVSVTSDGSRITVNYDTGGWGTVSPSTVVAVVDETLAKEGVLVGASGGQDKALLDLAFPGVTDFISYSGGAWSSAKGRFGGFEWIDGGLTVSRPATGLIRNGAFPSLTPRQTPYNVTLGSIGQNAIRVEFYDAAGNQVMTPDDNMKFFITDPAGATKLDPNGDFADQHGNIWFYALMVETAPPE